MSLDAIKEVDHAARRTKHCRRGVSALTNVRWAFGDVGNARRKYGVGERLDAAMDLFERKQRNYFDHLAECSECETRPTND